MIVSLELKCFRKHTELNVDFAKGLNVIRGPNEAGKSTLTEALLYAVYGSRVLRNKLAETVTWGHKESELKVRATFKVNSINYTFVRSKNGAECQYEGGLVTGQDEVTAFGSELFGADAKTAGLLTLASQNGLRGALDDGPAAVSGLMARLTDFDVVDRILALADENLLLGADAPIKAKLDLARQALVDAKASQPDPAEVAAAALAVAEKHSQFTVATDHVAKVLRPALAAAEEAYNAAKRSNEDRAIVQQTLARAQQRHDQIHDQLTQTQLLALDTVSEADMAALEQAARDEEDTATVLDHYGRFQALPAYPEAFWEGSEVTFREELDKVGRLAQTLHQDIRQAEGEINGLRRNMITSGKCPTCGHAALTDEHVAQHNAGVQSEIDAKLNSIAVLRAQLANAEADLKALQDVDRVGRTLAAAVAKIDLKYLAVDGMQYPHRVTWTGPKPGGFSNEARTRLRAARQKNQAAAHAAGQARAMSEQLLRLKEEIHAAQTALDQKPEIDLAPLTEAYNKAAAEHIAGAEAAETLSEALRVARETAANLERILADATQRINQATARIAEHEQDLKSLAFNNALVKKLKAIKPAITDHLWNTVLAAVSNFFSGMRGEQSVVTKEAEGFKINGRHLESYSGSTLDVLALAVRVALSKTFIPHASFLVLDEPAHGCDDGRTGNVLGFLAGTGFDQVILASHDPLSESVADNLIQLGE